MRLYCEMIVCRLLYYTRLRWCWWKPYCYVHTIRIDNRNSRIHYLGYKTFVQQSSEKKYVAMCTYNYAGFGRLTFCNKWIMDIKQNYTLHSEPNSSQKWRNSGTNRCLIGEYIYSQPRPSESATKLRKTNKNCDDRNNTHFKRISIWS